MYMVLTYPTGVIFVPWLRIYHESSCPSEIQKLVHSQHVPEDL